MMSINPGAVMENLCPCKPLAQSEYSCKYCTTTAPSNHFTMHVASHKDHKIVMELNYRGCSVAWCKGTHSTIFRERGLFCKI